MAIVSIRDVTKYGLVGDVPPHELPANAWSGAKNIRFLDGSVQKARGHSSVITPAVAPYALFPAPVVGSLFWVYAGLAKIHAFIGATDGDITRALGDYTATDTSQWQGGTFNGLFYLNNGVDDPQLWSPQATTTQLVKLTNWPASTKAKVLRHFRNYLVALDVTKSSTRYPRMIKWSHAADPGTLPTSWDEADPTVDAGESTLSEGYDTIIDCLQLGDLNIVYTENETWAMRYVGGNFIFNIFNLFRGSGILGQGCAVQFKNMHFVLTQDDVVIHNGSSLETRIDRRLRNWLFSRLTSTAFYTTKVIPHYLDREVWVCFAQGGGTALNTALIWNWRDDTWAIRDLPDIRAVAFVPQALVGSSSTWEGLGGTWAAPTGFGSTWGDPERASYTQSIMVASPNGLKIFNIDSTLQFDSDDFESYVEHSALSAVGMTRDGEVASDPNSVKLVRAVIPHISAAVGTVVDVSIGSRMDATGEITWAAPKQFVVGTDFKVDCYTVGRFYGVKLTCMDEFKLQGYDVDVATLGLL